MAEAPREIVAGEPTGQLELVASKVQPMAAGSGATAGGTVDLILHGPTHATPTPARTGSRDGSAVGLSPGTSDATTRLPEPALPAAGVLTIRGNSWSWRPVIDQP
jgi:hypothetical protein